MTQGRLALALLAVALWQCSETSSEADGTGGNAGAGGISGGVDGSVDADSDAPHLNLGDVQLYDGPEYDGDQSCAPDAAGSFRAVVSCCEGMPCEGSCLLLGGKWQCSCLGIEGGCAQFGNHCCKGGCNDCVYKR